MEFQKKGKESNRRKQRLVDRESTGELTINQGVSFNVFFVRAQINKRKKTQRGRNRERH